MGAGGSNIDNYHIQKGKVMITAETAKILIQEQDKKAKWSFSNIFGDIPGIIKEKVPEIQEFLNKILQQKGVLSEDDEKNLKDILQKQEAERLRVKNIRKKNTLILISVATISMTAIYFFLKKTKK